MEGLVERHPVPADLPKDALVRTGSGSGSGDGDGSGYGSGYGFGYGDE